MIPDQLDALIRQAIAARVYPGCVVGVSAPGGQEVRAFGKPTYDGDGRIAEDSIYDTASLTKTIVTATLVHQLIDAGRCGLTEPVCAYIPEFAARAKHEVLMEHLLSYTVELRSDYYDDWKGDTSRWTFPQLLQMFCAAPLKAPPGSAYLYTDATAMLLAEVIRRIEGRDLSELADERIFSRLGMGDSTLDPASRDRSRIVPAGYRPDGRLIWAFPNDEKAEVAYAAGIQSGLAGLFSTAPDILRWTAMMLNDGRTVSGAPVLSPAAVRRMTHDRYPEKPFRSALGWGDGPTFQSLQGVGGSYLLAKGGYTGCFMIGDPAAQKVLVLLANRVHPARPPDLTPWQDFRRNAVRSVFGG
jgi:CubicO group peptidase (beta-lactamase class C family)